MELSNSKIKKFVTFSQKALRTFQPKIAEIKKVLLSYNIKKIQETETPKKFPYISGNGNP